MKYVPLAVRFYRVHIAWQLESVFYSFQMNNNGAQLRQKIRDVTYQYIDYEAPAQYREMLRPDYEPGCKRRVNTNTYFACLHSPQMHLAKERATKLGPRHVETEAGVQYPADVIIYATGSLTQEWLFRMEVRGEGGLKMHDVWDAAGGAEAYKGTVINGVCKFLRPLRT